MRALSCSFMFILACGLNLQAADVKVTDHDRLIIANTLPDKTTEDQKLAYVTMIRERQGLAKLGNSNLDWDALRQLFRASPNPDRASFWVFAGEFGQAAATKKMEDEAGNMLPLLKKYPEWRKMIEYANYRAAGRLKKKDLALADYYASANPQTLLADPLQSKPIDPNDASAKTAGPMVMEPSKDPNHAPPVQAPPAQPAKPVADLPARKVQPPSSSETAPTPPAEPRKPSNKVIIFKLVDGREIQCKRFAETDEGFVLTDLTGKTISLKKDEVKEHIEGTLEE